MTSSTDGVASTTSRVRDRIVGSTSSTVGAQSSQTVRSVGSSIALSSALAAWSVSRSASSTTITCQRRPTGASAEVRTSSRTSSTPIESFSVRVTRTSGWEPTATSWQEWHCAAAALLALERGGERDRGVGAARAGRAGEQPGVGHVAGDRPLEPLDHRGPGRPGRPRRCHRARRSRPHRLEQRRQPGVHGVGDLLDVAAGVEDEVVVGIGLRQPEELLRAPAGGTRSTRPRCGRARRTGSARRSGSRSSSTVRCGRRSPVAHRATRSSSAPSSERPAPW